MRDALVPAAVGAVAGAAVGGVLWLVFTRVVDAQVSATLQREVPPQIRTALDEKFRSLGLTPAMAANIRTIVGGLDQGGLFSTVASAVGR